MEYLLDTDMISYYCKGNPEVIAKMGIVADTDLFISVVSTIEIDFGYATNLEAKNSHHYRYAALLERVNLIEFSGSDALLTTQIRTELYPDKMFER